MIDIKYKGEDYVVHTAWAEAAKGPGWSNRIYWVIASPKSGPWSHRLTKMSIQEDEMSIWLMALFDVSVATSKSVTSQAASVLASRGFELTK